MYTIPIRCLRQRTGTVHFARGKSVLATTTFVRRLVAALFQRIIVYCPMGRDSRDLIRELEADGWRYIGATGSHQHYKHPTKPGKVTVPHPKRDLHPKTVRSIYRQAGLKEPR
jgi:predicted RNA binding protein YcfA (HicA-like mRNA interferase family)